jgi:hypothetical protein
VVVFLFLIDHAARLLRPVSIVGRIAHQGLKVIDDVYPNPIRGSSVPMPGVESLAHWTGRSHIAAVPQSSLR